MRAALYTGDRQLPSGQSTLVSEALVSELEDLDDYVLLRAPFCRAASPYYMLVA